MKWLLRVGVLAMVLLFLAAGTGKLVGAENMVMLFNHFGLPHWFMLFTGATEIGAALLILVPIWQARFFGASILAATMIIGAAFHMVFDPLIAAVPALILAALTAALAMTTLKNNGHA